MGWVRALLITVLAATAIVAIAPASVAADLHMKAGQPVALRDQQSGGHVRFVTTVC
jgi:hypothetical protein